MANRFNQLLFHIYVEQIDTKSRVLETVQNCSMLCAELASDSASLYQNDTYGMNLVLQAPAWIFNNATRNSHQRD